MASFLSKIKSVPRNLPAGLERGAGLKPFLMDKGERAIFAAGLGAAKGYYYEKAIIRGVGIEAWVGVGGYLASAFLGHNAHLERLGDAGMTTYLYSVAASWGADRAGRSVASTKQVQGKKQVVGVIPERAEGAFLSPEEMANYSNRR